MGSGLALDHGFGSKQKEVGLLAGRRQPATNLGCWLIDVPSW